MKIVLVGYMGCGKSAISRSLSKMLGLKRIDLDDFIEEKEGMKISEIFANKGEIYFRKLETVCLKELVEQEESVILSLGGGTPCFGNNMEIVNKNSTSIYLQANVPTLTKRLRPEKVKRPLIARIADADLAEFIGKHLFERSSFYGQAQISVTVDDKSVTEIVGEIKTLLV